MTYLVAHVVAAIQQVRASEPRKCDECYTGGVFWPARHTYACEARWAAKVDARLAACVEAMHEVGKQAYRALLQPAPDRTGMRDVFTGSGYDEAGLAAFLAAAAQEETT